MLHGVTDALLNRCVERRRDRRLRRSADPGHILILGVDVRADAVVHVVPRQEGCLGGP